MSSSRIIKVKLSSVLLFLSEKGLGVGTSDWRERTALVKALHRSTPIVNTVVTDCTIQKMESVIVSFMAIAFPVVIWN